VIRRLLPALLLLWAGYAALLGGEYSWSRLREIRAEIATEARRLDELRSANEALRVRVGALESDPVALERIARERFGMIRPGELLYRFAEPMEPMPAPDDSSATGDPR